MGSDIDFSKMEFRFLRKSVKWCYKRDVKMLSVQTHIEI